MEVSLLSKALCTLFLLLIFLLTYSLFVGYALTVRILSGAVVPEGAGKRLGKEGKTREVLQVVS